MSSYSRYFSTATHRQMGRALVPRVDSAPTTGWVPHPGASPMATGTMNTRMINQTTKMAAPL